MTILDRYMGSRLIAALVKTILALVLLFVLVDLLTHRRSGIVKHDVPLDVVALYYVLYVPKILYKYQGAALGMLVSALLVLGNAAQNSEVVAALAGGISLRRLVRVPVLIAAGLAVAVFVLQETAGVAAGAELERIESRYFPRSAQRKRPGVSWAHLSGGWTCHVVEFNRVAMTGEGVLMHAIHGDTVQQIQARRIFWDEEEEKWMLEDGSWFVFDPEKEWENEVFRITQRPAPIVERPEELFALDAPPDTKTVAMLAADIRKAEQQGRPVQRNWVQFHAKFSQPALSFIMIWLAIPFAIRLRKGGIAISFGLSIAIALAYILLFRISMGLGHIADFWPPAAAWLANVVFLAAGLVMFHKTPT